MARVSSGLVVVCLACLAVVGAGCGGASPGPPRAKPSVAKAQPSKQTAASADTKAAARIAKAEKKAAVDRKAVAKKNAAKEAEAKKVAAKVAAEKRLQLERLDSSERFLVFAPGGPLVVRVTITIDGQPLRAALTDKIEKLLAVIDANRDGKAEWEEASKTKEFALGDLASPDEEEREAAIEFFDQNSDELVDRDEVRAFLRTQETDKDDFTFDNTSYGKSVEGDASAVWRLLDTDEDRSLSVEEFLSAEERLKSRDADDDDLLFPTELEDPSGQAMAGAAMREQMPQQGPRSVMLLGPNAEWPSIRYAIGEFYPVGNDDASKAFPMLPRLFSQLDANGNGSLERDEYQALNAIPPHIELEANFGQTGELQPGVALKSLAEELGPVSQVASSVGEGVVLFLPGIKLRLLFQDPGRGANYEQAAQAQLAAYDADKNGYLEKKEFPENVPGLDASFADIDADKDEKLYPKELAAYVAKQQANLLRQVRIASGGQDDALFSALDATNDSLLGLREMHVAGARLRSFDASGDGVLVAEEVPLSLAVTVQRGVPQDDDQPQAVPQPSAPTARPAPSGPGWFVRMDSNADQDVSLREFLGTPDQFQQVDANGDGFIDPKEAEAVKAEAESTESGATTASAAGSSGSK